MSFRTAFSLLLLTYSLSGAGPVERKGTIGPHRVEPGNMYVRFVAVVPLVGTGRPGDPKRPDFLPAPTAKVDPNGILGFTMQLSDDRKHALVEFVARNRAAFAPLLADRRPDVKVFERGKAGRAVIEAELRKWKTGFNLDAMTVRLP